MMNQQPLIPDPFENIRGQYLCLLRLIGLMGGDVLHTDDPGHVARHLHHPGWSLRTDWPAVRDSWVLIFNNTFSMTFELTDVMAQVAGDMAWVVCVENITTHQSDEPQQAKVLATNLFERIGDEWLLIHHHGSAVMGPH